MKKNPIITGTIILIITGFISRLIGFFYRIYLSQAIGAEGLGIYQMIFPIYSICFALCCGSIQTSISKNVASRVGANSKNSGKAIFQTGLLLSFTLAVMVALFVNLNADFLATHVLLEPRCAPLLKILVWAIPLCSINSCISGYYYGRSKTHTPAISQLVEQLVRVFSFYLISKIWLSGGMEISVSLAVIVLVLGEAASSLFSAIVAGFHFAGLPKSLVRLRSVVLPNLKMILLVSVPLTANRLCISVLQSAEAIMIPNKLQQFGLTGAEAYSVYGIFTGMALPFILFPSAITNSISVMLLPAVAESQATGDKKKISQTTSLTIALSLAMGILCLGLFLVYGHQLGTVVFKSQMAGTYITILAWICPFMYITSTVGSILNGSGKIVTTFIQHLIGLFIRLLFVIFLIPRFGILAYLWGLLVSELIVALLHLLSLRKVTEVNFYVGKELLLPIFFVIVSIGVSRSAQIFLGSLLPVSPLILLFISCAILCITYVGFLYLFEFRKNFIVK